MDDDVWYEVPELADELRPLLPSCLVKVTYAAGPSHLEQSGSIAELSILIGNSPLNGGPRDAMAALAEGVVPAGVAWLRRGSPAVPGTRIVITFGDAWKAGPFMGSNALENFRFELSESGEAVEMVSELSPEMEAGFRQLRYRMSGRKPPS